MTLAKPLFLERTLEVNLGKISNSKISTSLLGPQKKRRHWTGCFFRFLWSDVHLFWGWSNNFIEKRTPFHYPPPLLLSWQSRYNAKNAPKISCHMCHMCPMGNDGCIFYKGFFATRFGSDNNLHRGWYGLSNHLGLPLPKAQQLASQHQQLGPISSPN